MEKCSTEQILNIFKQIKYHKVQQGTQGWEHYLETLYVRVDLEVMNAPLVFQDTNLAVSEMWMKPINLMF